MAGAPNMDGEQITTLRTRCPYALYPSPIRLSGYSVFGVRTFGVRFVHIHTRRLVTVISVHFFCYVVCHRTKVVLIEIY